jgi:hypothetical protein
MNADKRRFKRSLQDKSISYPRVSAFICGFIFLKFSASLRLCGLFFLFAVSFPAQDLPGEIRGYKVHKAKVSVRAESGGENNQKEDLRVAVKFDKPELVKITPLGATFEVSGEMTVSDQSGKVDFLTFRDFRVNGLKVEIEEYDEPFEIRKNEPARLKKPVRIFVSATQSIKGGLKEIFRSEKEWQVTGRVFVFGKFRKLGFKFKRVVPVDVNLKIINPLRESEQ